MSDKIYIVAGNMSEFRSYVDRKLRERWNRGDTSCTMSDYVMVHSAERLRGLVKIKGFYIGTYEQRSDINEIRQQIAIIKSRSA